MAIRRTLAEFSDDIATADIADDAVTGDKLANDIAISTSGAITTTGAFTSIGIDDNADAATITIDDQECVGIGGAPPNYYSNFQCLQVGNPSYSGTLQLEGRKGNYGATITRNAYFAQTGITQRMVAAGYAVAIDLGDGSITFNNSGTSSRSADEAFTNTNLMTISKEGAVTKPLQPAFLAQNTSTQTSVSSGATVVFANERFDLQNNYASNTFTAPVTGKYHFDWMCSIQDINTGEAWYYLTLVTSNETFIYSNIIDPDMYSGGSTRNYVPFQGALTVDMDANDTAIIRINWSTAGSWGGYIRDYRWFSGYLVC